MPSDNLNTYTFVNSRAFKNQTVTLKPKDLRIFKRDAAVVRRSEDLKGILALSGVTDIAALGTLKLSGNLIATNGLLTPKPDLLLGEEKFSNAFRITGRKPNWNLVGIGGTARRLNMKPIYLGAPLGTPAGQRPSPLWLHSTNVPLDKGLIVAETLEIEANTNLILMAPHRHLVIIAKKLVVGENVTFTWQRPSLNVAAAPAGKPDKPNTRPVATSIAKPPVAQGGTNGANGNGMSNVVVPTAPTIELWTLEISGQPGFDVGGMNGVDGGAGQDGGDGADGTPGCSDDVDFFGFCKRGPGNGGDGGPGGPGGVGGAGSNGGAGGRVMMYAPGPVLLQYAQALAINDGNGVKGRGGPGGRGGRGGAGGPIGSTPHGCEPKSGARAKGNPGADGANAGPGPDGADGTKDKESGLFEITREEFLIAATRPLISTIQPSRATAGEVVVLSGLNFTNTDKVVVDGITCAVKMRSDTTIGFVVPDTIGGSKPVTVVQEDGTTSADGTLYLVPSVTRVEPAGRLSPGSTVTVIGSGFAPNMRVRLNNEEQPGVQFIDKGRVQFSLRRPQNITPSASGEAASLSVALADLMYVSNAVTITIDTFRLLVLGDSVHWGQGLRLNEKFHDRVLEEVKRLRNGINVYRDVLAHSGARIGLRDTTELPPLDGEVPTPYPTIVRQAKSFNDFRETVDLVLVNGGINDVSVDRIIDPRTDPQDLINATNQACGDDMTALLQMMAVREEPGRPALFPNARIVVTGYYQIISEDSDLELLLPVLMGLGFMAASVPGMIAGGLLSETARHRIIANCAAFASTANAALQRAVTATNALIPGGPRVFFADPRFTPQNAVLASNAFLFGIQGDLSPVDPLDVSAPRGAACELAGSGRTDVGTCKMASTGHPNVKGTEAFFNAIRPFLNT